MPSNIFTIFLLYVVFVVGISIVLEFVKEREPYADITNYEFKKLLEDYKQEYKKDLMQQLTSQKEQKHADYNSDYEQDVLYKAQQNLKSLGDYDIVQDKTNFQHLDERFNDFQVGTKSVDFFKENPYDNMYYLNK